MISDDEFTVKDLKELLKDMPDDLPIKCINENGDQREVQAYPSRYEDLDEEEKEWYNGEGQEKWRDCFIITPW